MVELTGNMPFREREPRRSLQGEQTQAREVYLPSPSGPDDLIERTIAIENELVNPENLSPRSIYSLVIARNQGVFVEARFGGGRVSAYRLKEGYELGLHAMMRSKHYNQEEHGQLRADLWQGYLQQVHILQEQGFQDYLTQPQSPEQQ
jgi:hypothetical protein